MEAHEGAPMVAAPVMRSAQSSVSGELWPEAKARAAAVRERVEGRPEAVPHDIERRNLAAFRRNKGARKANGPAGDAGVPESVREVISSSGQSLDASIQRAVEDRMGDSFADVRIHTGPSAAKACEDINARAFTVGNHIAFNSGEYDPGSPQGQHLLAHELAHVRQQTGGAISMMPQANVELEIDPDPQLEREAEATAQRVMEGGELGIQRLAKTEVHVQRMAGMLSAVTTSLGHAKQMMDIRRDERHRQQQERADEFATLGQTDSDSSLEARVGELEKAVSKLGSYASEQVAPKSATSKAIETAKQEGPAATGTLAAGGLLSLLGAGPVAVAVGGSILGKAAGKYAHSRAPDAAGLKPEWMDDLWENAREYLDEKLRKHFGGGNYESTDKTDF